MALPAAPVMTPVDLPPASMAPAKTTFNTTPVSLPPPLDVASRLAARNCRLGKLQLGPNGRLDIQPALTAAGNDGDIRHPGSNP